MRKTYTTLGLTLAVGLALSACQRGGATAITPLPKPIGSTLPMTPQPRSEIISSTGGPADGYAQATLIARQRLRAADTGPEHLGVEPMSEGPRDARPVSLAFRDLAADDALRVIIGQLLGRSFLIEPDVKGPVTLEVNADMTTRDLYDLLDSVCILHGWSVERRGQTLVVRSAKQRASSSIAPIMSARAAIPSERPGVRVFSLQHIAPQQAAEAVKPLLSPGGVPIVAGRLLAVADTIAQLNRLGALLAKLDTPAFDGVEIWTYELAHQTAADAVRVLGALAQQAGLASASDALATFVAIPRTPRIMVIARDPSLQPMIREWVTMVDQPPDLPRRMDYVYHIQNLDPTALKPMLDSFYAGRLEHDANDPNDHGMRVVVSTDEDLLLIRATPTDYADLMAMLERIDRPRQQVHLQAIVAEVTLSDELQYGVEYFLSTKTNSGLLDLTGAINQFSPANPAGSAVFLASSGFAVIEALKTKSDIAVLSAPSTFVRDKSEASLKVGASVPIITAAIDSQTQVGGTSGVRNEVQYRDTGVILGVTPKINQSGEVTMTIKLEVTDAVPTTSSGIDSPTFTTRIAQTTVTVPHGQTVLIGGAIESRSTNRSSRIPLLGDIPGLGAAFQSRDKKSNRTELLLAITPTVVNDPADTTRIVSDFVQSAAALRESLAGFEAPIPDVLRTADARALEQATRAFSDAARAQAAPAPQPAVDGPHDITAPPADGALQQLATLAPQGVHTEQAAMVALFLKGLARRAPSPGEG